MTTTLLLDSFAWVRLGDAAVPDDRAAELAAALEAGGVAACLPFLLEAGYSARNALEHRALANELLSLPYFHIDVDVERRALDAQRQLVSWAIVVYRPSTSSSRPSQTAMTSPSSITTVITT